MNIGVLFGGRSSEHEISILSAGYIYRTLNRRRFQAIPIYIDPDGRFWLVDPAPAELPKTKEAALSTRRHSITLIPGADEPVRTEQDVVHLDCVFPVLHGQNGEDGTVQGLMHLLNIPFVGCDILGSTVCMDKAVMKDILSAHGIPTSPYHVFETHTRQNIRYEEITRELGSTLFIKPARTGSSVGVSKASSASEFSAAVDHAFRFDSKILVERAIQGREVECAVLGNETPEASLPGEILPRHAFYSYEAKYLDPEGAGLKIPADLTPSQQQAVQKTARRAYSALNCEGLSRVDMFLLEDGGVLINEVNTLPGFTAVSLYPRMWEVTGLPGEALLDRLVDLAIERHQLQSSLSTERE